MSHVNTTPDCPSCIDKLGTAHVLLTEWFWRVKKQWPDAHISWAFRDQLAQEAAVKEGKSKEPWPFSKHNHMEDGKPESLALDLFQLDTAGVATFSPRFYLAVAEFAKTDPVKTRWGGTFIKLRDYDHFELVQGP